MFLWTSLTAVEGAIPFWLQLPSPLPFVLVGRAVTELTVPYHCWMVVVAVTEDIAGGVVLLKWWKEFFIYLFWKLLIVLDYYALLRTGTGPCVTCYYTFYLEHCYSDIYLIVSDTLKGR